MLALLTPCCSLPVAAWCLDDGVRCGLVVCTVVCFWCLHYWFGLIVCTTVVWFVSTRVADVKETGLSRPFGRCDHYVFIASIFMCQGQRREECHHRKQQQNRGSHHLHHRHHPQHHHTMTIIYIIYTSDTTSWRSWRSRYCCSTWYVTCRCLFTLRALNSCHIIAGILLQKESCWHTKLKQFGAETWNN